MLKVELLNIRLFMGIKITYSYTIILSRKMSVDKSIGITDKSHIRQSDRSSDYEYLDRIDKLEKKLENIFYRFEKLTKDVEYFSEIIQNLQQISLDQQEFMTKQFQSYDIKIFDHIISRCNNSLVFYR